MNVAGQFRRGATGRREKLIILTTAFLVSAFVVWAALFTLDEVAIGNGRVIPSSQVQEIQSVMGGRVKELLVNEGDRVKEGDLLALLDVTSVQAEAAEFKSRLRDGLAQQQLLAALIVGETELDLGENLRNDPVLVEQKTELFLEMLTTQRQAVSDLEDELELLQREMEIYERVSNLGGGTQIERLRLQQKIANTRTKLNSQRQKYRSDLRVELDTVNREVQQARIMLVAQEEMLRNNELRSPKNGIVQEILVSSAGSGVVPPNGTVMTIVPNEERLLIEARFSPRDIAFIAPKQPARIQVTAYDFSIYGDLEAEVLRVSPDSFQFEGRPDEYYFVVTLESKKTYFEPSRGKKFEIIPGMVTTSAILTGERTILQYLLKPVRKASEALRER